MSGRVILSSLVGSHMWGTNTVESDYDVREVVISPLYDLISPYRRGELIHPQKLNQPYSFLDGAPADVARYELNRFVGLLVKGNPTLIETLYGTKLFVDSFTQKSDVGGKLIRERQRFLNFENIFTSHMGFVNGQLRAAEKPKPERPIGKLLVSALIGARSCQQLLVTKNLVPEWAIRGDEDDLIIAAKNGDESTFATLRSLIVTQQVYLQRIYDEVNINRFTHDEEFIKEFLLHAYTN